MSKNLFEDEGEVVWLVIEREAKRLLPLQGYASSGRVEVHADPHQAATAADKIAAVTGRGAAIFKAVLVGTK